MNTSLAAPSLLSLTSAAALAAPDWLLRFESLFNPGRGLVFPCNAQGHVLLDALSDVARCNYLYARAVVGREFALPVVVHRH